MKVSTKKFQKEETKVNLIQQFKEILFILQLTISCLQQLINSQSSKVIYQGDKITSKAKTTRNSINCFRNQTCSTLSCKITAQVLNKKRKFSNNSNLMVSNIKGSQTQIT